MKKLAYTSMKGITLFEVLTAIIIFSTGILVILSSIGSNISWVKVIKTNDVATVLAKESMEMIYHTRDSNIEKGLSWDCAVIDASQDDYCGEQLYDGSASKYFIIDRDISDNSMYALKSITGPSDPETRLYIHTGDVGVAADGFWYNHKSSGGNATNYRRYIEVLPLQTHATHTDKVLQLRVYVDVDNTFRNKQVVLESIIGDIK